MRKIEIEEATGPLSEYVRNMDEGPLLLMAGGKPVAALIPVENADAETAALSTHLEFLALIERSRVRQRKEGGITSAEMRRRLEA